MAVFKCYSYSVNQSFMVTDYEQLYGIIIYKFIVEPLALPHMQPY